MCKKDILYGLGSGKYGENGCGDFVDISTPKIVDFTIAHKHNKLMSFGLDANVQIKKIVSGGRHNMILCEDGSLFAFGFGAHG